VSIRSLIQAFRSPSSAYALGTLVVTGGILGVIAYLSFEYTLKATSSDAFCMLCHADNIGPEYEGTVHDSNRLGFRVTCAQCHIPEEFGPKIVKKATAGVNDVFHTILGTISTPEKFEAHRRAMATATWAEMDANDSRECRRCHDSSAWDLSKQREKSQQYHTGSLVKGKTCIDCHKGNAHKLPEGIGEDEQIEGIDF